MEKGKKSLRTILSYSLMFAMLISSLFMFRSALAEPQMSNDAEGILVSQSIHSEYDLYKEFINTSDEDLLKIGYTKEQIRAMKNINYKDALKSKVDKLNKLDDVALKNAGYDKEHINIIRNYTGTEEQINALSASLALSTYKGSSSKSSSYSQINFRTDWTWSSVPVWLETDILAVSWTEGMYVDLNSSYTYANYDLYNEWYESYDRTLSTPVFSNLNTGAYIKFDIGHHNNDIGGLYAKKGKFGYKISRNAYVSQIAVQAKYGHNQMAVQPSVSIPAGLSISFSWSLVEAAILDKQFYL